ncbi:peptide chain release factor N(5)-glutamine methyltransferase [Pseudohoeflea coraliihabitans]|uniref:Release factor glutamine methyltransferase n=1 Tax=Pseudohoeflea coraliihabitans TaxID=2860393 RepID=A0ABS6WKI9_9HYPH|nr:peptide chain release factor N(5)-glutamine methyltransferase [Pseudohoeflea sp. DP4N28-3]MBW3096466.1 peptide chain release factor N(5)-glutamine methyltransferase [Pseudohoeflea sp. DP4N28-3]
MAELPEDPAPVDAVLSALRRAFTAAELDNPGFEARLLVSGLLDLSSTQLMLQPERIVDADELARLRAAARRRIAGEPAHRILGRRGFHGHDFALSPGTLEPRPDTETLVDVAISTLQSRPLREGGLLIADLGTGTGAVGLSIVAAVQNCHCIGVDLSPDAVATAAGNAASLGLSDRFAAVQGDWLQGREEQFDLIVSNPPYIASAEIGSLEPGVRLHDPLLALDGGADGLDAYRAIAAQASGRLRPDGVILVEIGIGQGRDVAAIFCDKGFVQCSSAGDLSAILRVLGFSQA